MSLMTDRATVCVCVCKTNGTYNNRTDDCTVDENSVEKIEKI